MSMTSSNVSVTEDCKTGVIPYDIDGNQSLEQTKKRKIGCGEDEQYSLVFVYVPSSSITNKKQKRKRRTTTATKNFYN